MIQRKQSLWLFIAALLNASVFFAPVYKYHTVVAGVDTENVLRVNNSMPWMIISLVMTLLPLIIIFLYQNRKRQMAMSFACILAVGSFISLTLSRVTAIGNEVPPPTNDTYWIGGVLPIVSLVFIFMAIFAIRKDEKLVRSVDRLR